VLSASRFRYLVRPSHERWEVTFGESGSCFLYETQAEAVEIARRAGRQHWETRGESCEVCLEVPGRPMEILAFFSNPDALDA
jgi:hypothetical protein